jgi:hypothetical protein
LSVALHQPQGPPLTEVLDPQTLAILAGSRPYAHVTALRGDTIHPQGLGMSRVLSKEALRRAFQDEAAADGPRSWWSWHRKIPMNTRCW